MNKKQQTVEFYLKHIEKQMNQLEAEIVGQSLPNQHLQHIHHINGDVTDNRPENLIRV